MYKYDLHVHTAGVSPCASMTGAEQARAYKELGFTGIVITDHYYKGFFEDHPYPTWKESMDRYYLGYYDAKEEGDKIGLDVFRSAEVTLASIRKDFIVIGVPVSFFYENANLFDLTQDELCDMVHSAGGLVFAAHPFRGDNTEWYPYTEKIDGVEVLNGNPLSNNKLAYSYAKDHGMLMCAGSDAHNKGDAGTGGIVISKRITDVTEFADVLRNEKIGFVKEI